MRKEIAQKILDKNVSDYNQIAASFSQVRTQLWDEFKVIQDLIKTGDKVLDLGCGNGRLRLLSRDQNVKFDYVGVDSSQELIKIAESNNDFKMDSQQFLVASMLKLPFADNSFNVVASVAVFHHIPSKQMRLKALQEVKRVLKPGGTLIMFNWNRWQKDYLHYIIKYTRLKLIGKSDLDFKDILIPWMNGEVKRYFHVFTLGELKKLVKLSGLKLEENYLSDWKNGDKKSHFDYLHSTNIVTIAKKW
ncbi:MAG: hypothetical protein CMI53_01770 [Parcubacteria group bacterium]|jgi:tRNA (uracil-5-)-methyltransferase TRM9|nr:hypothetical protein [Parcubacteria group bacterium]|tara:strand:+ start:271 stop:1011 length:741 start_codon:yes stop_codon:yes gene_type:complete